jgi:hypothetical protein
MATVENLYVCASKTAYGMQWVRHLLIPLDEQNPYNFEGGKYDEKKCLILGAKEDRFAVGEYIEIIHLPEG